jgi:hypothetical protein
MRQNARASSFKRAAGRVGTNFTRNACESVPVAMRQSHYVELNVTGYGGTNCSNYPLCAPSNGMQKRA